VAWAREYCCREGTNFRKIHLVVVLPSSTDHMTDRHVIARIEMHRVNGRPVIRPSMHVIQYDVGQLIPVLLGLVAAGGARLRALVLGAGRGMAWNPWAPTTVDVGEGKLAHIYMLIVRAKLPCRPKFRRKFECSSKRVTIVSNHQLYLYVWDGRQCECMSIIFGFYSPHFKI
jgi:hypothetical protein